MTDEQYMQRCLDLAKLGAGKVSPNPMVGAVIVHNDTIIGEGFHQAYGQAHAEVNAVQSVKQKDKSLLANSTIYVSLEPCCIHGNTPPCTDLIIRNHIPKVKISAQDFTDGVDGKGIDILRKNGHAVITGINAQKGAAISNIRKVFVQQQRPYIILKYAQSADGFMGNGRQAVWMSNAFSKRLVHKWRSETAAIMVGTNTARVDNPKLTNRLYFGNSPLRIVLDKSLKLSSKLHLFDDTTPTWVVTDTSNTLPSNTSKTSYVAFDFKQNLIPNLLHELYKAGKSSLIVEGGATLLNSFLALDLWDEARVFYTPKRLYEGIPAPTIPKAPSSSYQIREDILKVYYRKPNFS